MKFRHSLIYVLLLALIAGYYYYFEVLKKEQKEAAEKEARKIFAVKSDEITSMEVVARDKEPVQLRRNGSWKITAPVEADVEKTSVESLVNTIAGLSREIEVSRESQDLQPFGLQEPVPLRIRFQAGDQVHELLVGDKNPVGRGYYGRRADSGQVFLLETSSWSLLNKGLDELRRRSLFTFQPDDVLELSVEWKDGSAVQVKREEGASVWQTPGQADLRVKARKVENVLEQIQWLRAQSFLENRLENLESHGLKQPHAKVSLKLKGDRTAELALAARDKEGAKQILAVSSELPAVVQVDAGILEDLPKNLAALEDRSLIGFKSKDVTEVRWGLGDSQGHVVLMEPDKWGVRKESSSPEPLKEPWHVSSLLWDLQQVEYERKVDPGPAPPEKPYGNLELLSAGKSLATLKWEKSPSEDAAAARVWVEEGGQVKVFEISGETLRKAQESLGRILGPEKAKP
jgi:hypothetical protein